jgi:predicted HTH transcriptional regulator
LLAPQEPGDFCLSPLAAHAHAEGISPTEREFQRAGERDKPRLIFLKAADDGSRDPSVLALIRQAEPSLVRRRFATAAELIAGLYAALVQWLNDHQLIRSGPFDSFPCPQATLADLDPERMAWFIDRARQVRGFPLPLNASANELLTHLNLLAHGQPVHAAVLLFARQPQRFLLSSVLKAAHFHGTAVAKPFPSYQVFKGTVFELVDQAVDFVLARLHFAIGTADMIRRCREAGLSEPVFSLDDGFRIALGRPTPQPSSSVTTEETGEETKEETEGENRNQGLSGAGRGRVAPNRDLILAKLSADPELTIADLARLLNLSDSGVEYNLRKLRQDGRIHREGSTKAGRWVVLPPIQEPEP